MRTFLKIITASLCIGSAVNLMTFMMVGFMNTSFISDQWAIGTGLSLGLAVLMLIIYSEVYKVKII
jgi:hypothetical protein